MKYCLNYNRTSKYKDEVNELNIDFRLSDDTLLEFLQLHTHQRVNIFLSNKNEIEQYKLIKKMDMMAKENPEIDIAIKLPRYLEEFQEDLNKIEIPYYYQYIVTDWDTLIGYLESGVSDIYVGEHLCFELDKVSKIAHQYNAKVRVFPNICQNSWKTASTLKSFWIRPEDLKLFNDIIDIVEFFYDSDIQQDTYYEIYHKSQQWFGNLKEIIIGLDEDLDSRFVLPKFAERRMRCGKKCLKGGTCNMCDTIKDFSKYLEKAEISIKIKKDKEDNL